MLIIECAIRVHYIINGIFIVEAKRFVCYNIHIEMYGEYICEAPFIIQEVMQ